MTDSTQSTHSSLGQWQCPQCQAPLLPTPSGSVCSKGCGKLLVKMSNKAARRAIAILSLGLKDACQVAGGWIIDGDQSVIYQKDKEASKKTEGRKVDSLPKWLEEDQVLALDGHKVIVLKVGSSIAHRF
ncbi:hypothetical protein [Bremerella sp. P1]|uniref:hypothetical protein n=1 Tax=Bremerella sp. P1 TaxID=3026424 RepID=UPI002368C619|nr:hypothetical protein [Bremerella sp. P1]WDI44754.1 hypothetical protein PSR63_12490 [Bremerella sp. P1]